MSDPTKLAEVTDVPEGEVRVFDLGHRQVALFNIGGKFHACDGFAQIYEKVTEFLGRL